MTDKFKRTERRFVLSDSTVNEYGFRLLTSGYDAESFRKNPIGYYMHQREDGIVLKWEDLLVEDDKVTGVPVINLSNARGAQTYDEVENGFLNAASVGHIVVLEYSTDPEQMLPGQTGPTITKWYNNECSLVDIPGNTNALACLYDASELQLADLAAGLKMAPVLPDSLMAPLRATLALGADAPEADVLAAVSELAANAAGLQAQIGQLCADKETLQQQMQDLKRHTPHP